MRTNRRVGAIIIRDNKILLIKRFNNGEKYWVVPGGGVEDKETDEQALIREVIEETSINPKSFRLIVEPIKDGDHYHIFYLVDIGDEIPKLGGPEAAENNPNNSYELVWLPINELASLEPVYPVWTKEVIEKI